MKLPRFSRCTRKKSGVALKPVLFQARRLGVHGYFWRKTLQAISDRFILSLGKRCE